MMLLDCRTEPGDRDLSRRFAGLPSPRSICAATLLATCLIAAAPVVAQQQQQQTVPVGTVYAQRRPISQSRDFVGRVEAIDRVSVQARVTGYLEAILFTEGDFVKKGDPLYQIERGLFQAAVEQAQGTLERSKAAKTLTQIQLQRAEELLARNAGTAVARDQALAADQQAEGQILSDQANLDNANINLGYTDIRAPISGKISKSNITVGNVVGPSSGVLTVIVSQDPMYVTFPVSQREFLNLQASGKQVNPEDIEVRIRFANGVTYNQVGTISFVDVMVDRATDTVLVRAKMPNPDGVLVDGQLVTVTVQANQPQERVTIPQAALIADQQGIYVFVVEDGKAVVRRVKTGAEDGPDIVVNDGLKGGEQVIVEGLQSIRPGQPVQATPAAASLKTD
jgi:membrane fusion protein (multidrug efflux system)